MKRYFSMLAVFFCIAALSAEDIFDNIQSGDISSVRTRIEKTKSDANLTKKFDAKTFAAYVSSRPLASLQVDSATLTPLAAAIIHQQSDIVDVLLQNQAKPDTSISLAIKGAAKDPYAVSPLALSILLNERWSFERLVAAKASVVVEQRLPLQTLNASNASFTKAYVGTTASKANLLDYALALHSPWFAQRIKALAPKLQVKFSDSPYLAAALSGDSKSFAALKKAGVLPNSWELVFLLQQGDRKLVDALVGAGFLGTISGELLGDPYQQWIALNKFVGDWYLSQVSTLKSGDYIFEDQGSFVSDLRTRLGQSPISEAAARQFDAGLAENGLSANNSYNAGDAYFVNLISDSSMSSADFVPIDNWLSETIGLALGGKSGTSAANIAWIKIHDVESFTQAFEQIVDYLVEQMATLTAYDEEKLNGLLADIQAQSDALGEASALYQPLLDDAMTQRIQDSTAKLMDAMSRLQP